MDASFNVGLTTKEHHVRNSACYQAAISDAKHTNKFPGRLMVFSMQWLPSNEIHVTVLRAPSSIHAAIDEVE